MDKQIVIIGGGFGGLYAAKILGKKGFNVTLIDKQNFHLFQPLLYQVATGFLAPADIASPLRTILARYKSVRVIQDEVRDFDTKEKRVITAEGSYRYDSLIVAAGVTHSYFGKEEWERHAPGLKTLNDSLTIRSNILSAFEAAEKAKSDLERRRLLTFIIVGGGATGVELAGAIAELARATLAKEFRSFHPSDARIILFEGGARILSSFHQNNSSYAQNALSKLGVEVHTETLVTSLSDRQVCTTTRGKVETFEAETILWAAGIQASPLALAVESATGAKLDRCGRIMVEPDMTISGYPEIFVVGDLAHSLGANGQALPGLAPVAMQQGRYVAKVLVQRSKEREYRPFRYFDKGNMAVIGRGRAVAESFGLRLNGFTAWIGWAFIHIYFLIEFENKLKVFFNWAWNYLTNKRTSRLITLRNPKIQ